MSSDVTLEISGAVQHASWLARVHPPVEQLRPDLWSIPVPIPNGALRYVSVYALVSDSGLTLIDAGWDSDEAWTALSSGLESFGASIRDVRGCLVTHQHFDHIGLARRVREASGAWIALHPADEAVIIQPEFRDPQLAARAEYRWYVFLGAPPEEARALVESRLENDPRGTVAMPDRLVHDGDVIRIGSWALRAIHTPGHTPGHLCFFDDETGLLFAGDHILPRISPNISADLRNEVDALGDFLTSLRKIASYPAHEVLPAHEWRFRGLLNRVGQLVEHHEGRLAELLGAIEQKPGLAAWDLAGELTWSRTWDQYDGFMRLMAVTETMAHIVHLLRLGRIVASETTVPTYRRSVQIYQVDTP